MRTLLVCFFLSLAGLAVDTASAQVYQYDAVGRLQAANYPDGSSIRYEYDVNSNITRVRFASAPVALPPDGMIDEPADDVTIEAGESVTFEGSGADPDGAVPLAYYWDFDGGALDSTDEDPGAVSFATAGTYTIELTVTDATGLSDPTPDTVVVTVTTPPPPPPPPPPAPSSGGGGGSVLWLPLVLGLCLLARARRSLLLAALLVAGTAGAQSWTLMNSGTDQDLNDVWMPSQTLAYAVGDAGTVVRYDGNVWSLVDVGVTEQLNGVWGTAPNDVWIVGMSGTVLHFDGVDWTPVDIGAGTLPLNDVWTAGFAKPVYVVGARGVWSLEGGTWTREAVTTAAGVTFEPTSNLSSIRATDNYVVMTANNSYGLNQGLFVNFDWVGLSTFNLDSVWVYDDSLMMAVGDTTKLMNGGNPEGRSSADWQSYNVGIQAADVWGSDPLNIWAVGGATNFGRITYYDGNSNDEWVTEVTTSYRRFYGIDGVDRDNVIAVGALGTIYGRFSPPAKPTSANTPFAGISQETVNTFTGELVYETTDIALDTRMPMEFRRYYASNLRDQQTVGGQLSENWTHNYESRFDTGYGDNGDQVRITDYRGREYVFDVSGATPVLVSPTSANVGLVIVNGTHDFFDRDTGLRYRFDTGNGRLISIEDRNGNRHTLLYNQGYLVGVSDGASGLLSFSYTPTGKLERVFVDKSTTLETVFTYESGVLVSATSPSGVVSRYSYVDSRRLTGIETGSGTADAVTPQTWEYDSEGRVAATVLTNAGRFEYGYNGNQTEVVGPSGFARTHVYDDSGNLISITSALRAITSFTYDARGRRNSITDPLNRTTTWNFDAQSGRVSNITEPGGFQTQFTYTVDTVADGADFYDLDVVTLPNDATIEYGFDARGNLELLIDEIGNVSLFEYDAAGDLVRSENPAGGVTTYSYFIDGLPRSIIDPNGNERLFSYDPFLRLEIDQFGSRSSEYVYTDRFIPDQIRDRSGTVLDYTFNQADNISRIDRSDGYFEEYRYDNAGRIVGLNVADATFWTFGYDNFGRLATVTDPNLRVSRYTYDADGRLQTFTDVDDRIWSFSFAADGQLSYYITPGGEQIDFEYGDPRGYLSAVVNGIERSGLSYDALGLLATATDPEERVNTFERNLRGNVQRIVDSPSGAQRLFGSDVFGNVTSYTDPLGGLRELDFGDDNLLDSATDPLGNTTRFARDTENRVESIDYADGLNVSVQYAGSGLPGRIQASDGTDITIDSTPEGQITGGTELTIARTPTGKPGNNNGIGIEYNNDDRVSRVTFANGRYINYEYNGRGDVVRVSDWLGAVTTITPTDVGKIDVLTFPNGLTTDYDYDRAARITHIRMGSLGAITVNRDVLGRISSVDRTLPVATDMPNEDRSFAYNLASQIEGGTYDVRGNQLQHGENSRTWDALNRLTSTGNAADQVVVGYDALGGVTRIAASAGERTYVQNYALGKPRISIERDGAGNDLWYYVHTFGGRLLYRISPTGSRQFYHFDENGNTVLLTSDTGAVIQSYFVAPHGEILNKSGNEENSMVTQAEAGGQNFGDSGTLKLGSTFVDMNAGHALRPKIRLKAGYTTQTSFDSQYGRSLAPGLPFIDAQAEAAIDGSRSFGWQDELEELLSRDAQAIPKQRIEKSLTDRIAEMYGLDIVGLFSENPQPALRSNTTDLGSASPSDWSTRQAALRALGVGDGPKKIQKRRFPKGFSLPPDQADRSRPAVESILKEVGFNLVQ